METLVYYVLPNIVLFGGLYLVAKGTERASWYIICNYETIMKQTNKGKM